MDICTPIVAKGFTVGHAEGVLGFSAGAGGSVVQQTDRATGVEINSPSGNITTDDTSLAAEAAVEFTVTNACVEIDDVVSIAIRSGSNGGNTSVAVSTVADGSFAIKVSNNNAAAGDAETGAIIINFAVIKGASS